MADGTPGTEGTDFIASINEQSRAIWDHNAEVWDARIGEGGGLQPVLVEPACDRLLALQPDERVLEVACGNGSYSRRMAAQGAWVLATDFSARLLELAAARTGEHDHLITYRQVDATSEAQLLSLSDSRFDAVVCNMALMDMPAVTPLAHSLPRLLKAGGRFVFSVMHPCFNTTGTRFMAEEAEATLDRTVYSIKVERYLDLVPAKGLALANQPVPQYYFHRPLHALLAPFFAAGLVIDALEEPRYDKPSPGLGWGNLPEIPPVLLVRMRTLPRS